jgi:hypothetical protein
MQAEDCIFIQDKTKPVFETTSSDTRFYTLLGKHDFVDENQNPRAKTENKNVVAKSISKDNKDRFLIKIGTYGKIFNPIGLFSEGNNQKFISKIGKKQFEFKEVNKKVFDMYVRFLTTKNLAWLNNAEREMV